MRLALLTLFVFMACGNIAAFRYPAKSYGFHPHANKATQHEVEAQARQLLWGVMDLVKNNIRKSILRTTFTAVVKMTCTKSMSNHCFVGQEPFTPAVLLSRSPSSEVIEADENESEQYPFAPTTVQQVESTLLPTRQARDANSQYFLDPRLYPNQLQDIQSALYNSPYDPLQIEFRDSYSLPADGQRWLFGQMPTVTSTVATIYRISMVTEIPKCSKAGPIPQCANA